MNLPASELDLARTLNDSAADAQVLIVDDTPANLDLLCQVLEGAGYRVLAVLNGQIALRVASEAEPDLILLDVMMPEMDGFEICRRLKASEATAQIPVLFVSARDDTESLVEGFAAGGVDYLAKPINADEVLTRVGTHLKLSRLAQELRGKNEELSRQSAELRRANEALQQEMRIRRQAEDALQVADGKLSAISDREAERWGITGFVGRSRMLTRILNDIRRVRNFGSVNVLITGESGTGKELVARAIHFGSSRAKQPFIAVNCVAIPEQLAESMLFGHVRGAFTGATMDRKGYFELADGGTLFLDEIGDMPAPLQAKLLRVLEDGRITPLGASRERQVDVRIVAATNADLQSQITGGAFRQDLYFRLAQYCVEVPPLRNRGSDIPLLAEHFVRVFAGEMGLPVPAISPEALASLAAHPFPGNVRELKNVIERAMIESEGQTITPTHLALGPRRPHVTSTKMTAVDVIGPEDSPAGGELPLNLDEAEMVLIRRALAETGGNIAEAARKLGVNRTRIYRKLGEIRT